MEVTKSNFEQLFPEIVTDIGSATFVSFDGEFTGLQNGYDTKAFDSPEEVYHKIRAGSIDFLLIQFGLSIFKQDAKTGKYKNKTYVFYLFPWHRNSLGPDCRFLCQTSSIHFLISHNFDFNKLFKEGIPYLNSTEESNFADAMETKRNYQANFSKNSSSSPRITIPKQHKQVVDDALEQIDKVVKGEENEVRIEKNNAYLRKLIYQSYEQKYGSVEGVLLRTENGEMVCRRGEDPAILDQKELEASLGFSRVIRELSAKGCLVVGHNMLLDLAHLIHRFIDPLPADYNTFKEMLHTLFPRLMDTKMISSEEPLKELVGSTTLKSLDEAISKPPFHLPQIESEDGYSYPESGGQLHDAGYDAFLTGKIFLALVRNLDPDNKKCNIDSCRPIEKFENKLFLMKAPDTCIDLVNPDPVPKRDHVFHVQFPSSWTSNEIYKVFNPFGPVQVYWLSDTTAWVVLLEREQARSVLNATLPLTVTPYYRFIKEAEAQKRAVSPAHTTPRKKRKHSDDRRRESGVGTQAATESPKPTPESEIKKLEVAATVDDGAFNMDSSWD